MRVVTFKLSEDELEELDRKAAMLGVPRSELIRKAIREYLRQDLKPTKRGYIKIRYVRLV